VRTLTRRLLILPPALLLVHFIGFAYAHLVRPLRIAANPFLAGSQEHVPLWPAYRDYLSGIRDGGLGR
jgi:hypothetical protein